MSANPSNETAAIAAVAGPAPPSEWLTFRLGAEEYAIDILSVQEIRSYEHPTRIANLPAHFRGIVNLRGVIVPILDLRMCFGTATPRYDDATATIVLNVLGRVVGIVVDAVSDVLELEADAMKAFPDMRVGVDDAYITGIGSLQTDGRDRMLILLDIAALLAGASGARPVFDAALA